ncbi:hypothetical protein NSE01_07830 [Novosphingobium sediminis]|uniref:Uncharacterized protein n=1 Tax=Novosphingobium sediminis TaxID=707214 RepID=A0A512AGX7_9SPHN|nr:hypothetical protein NSE01_07830 [Novosphingobium sediminis]
MAATAQSVPLFLMARSLLRSDMHPRRDVGNEVADPLPPAGGFWGGQSVRPGARNHLATQKKTPAIPWNRRGQVIRAGCVRGGVGLPYGILVGAAAGAGAAAAVTIGPAGRRAG